MNIIPENCTSCKKCEKVCPTQTLDIDNNTEGDYCIKCYQCLSVCEVRNEETDVEIIGPYFQNGVQPFDFELLLQQRRSVRIFKDEDVKTELLEEFIHRMRFSPTASNTQPLSFTIVKDKKALKAVNDITIQTLTKTFQIINPLTKHLINSFLGKSTYKEMKTSKSKFLRKAAMDENMICYNAPALVMIHAKKSPTNMPECDANIWLGMAMLYAQTLDLATCANGYIINAAKRNKKLKQIINIPEDHTIYGAILMGYPKNKYINRIDRKDPEVNII
ncbi:nitroreductase family protein [Carboxylicivirga linearis]|uniref:Nitroreductase family protein n=1 Tax=Carboxylicivirga linearis TaxID=1628157 RepID=A0ABS5JXV6_9BACT|nr:nitroreductase family protein [Carboxylicivirga linearis]MBS2099635.1 nitroreductase family protein [Carboxylicivirga linearis]